MALGASAFVLLPALVTAFWVTGLHALLGAIPYALLVGVGSLWVTLKRNPRPTFVAGQTSVDGEGELTHAGSSLARAGELVRGFVVPGERGSHRVRLEKKRGLFPVEIEVPDLETGRALLSALGLAASQTTAETTAVGPIFALPLAAQIALIASVPLLFTAIVAGALQFLPRGVAGPYAVIASFFVLSALVAASLKRRSVTIGTDGIFLRWLLWSRFVPFERVQAVRLLEARGVTRTSGVELALDSGPPVRIPVGWSLEAPQAALLRARIEEAREAFEERPTATVAEALSRGEDDATTWLTRLRGLAAGANADMRTAPLPAAEIERVLGDASLDAEARIGAALALATHEDGQRDRVRIVARTVAAPKLRIVLERIADATTDEQFLDAIGVIEAEASVTPARPRVSR